MKNSIKPIYARVFLVVCIFTGYGLSVARTASLWDCGEFIAAAHTLGIPHPPGTPFYLLLGKFWELLLFAIPSVAFKINLLSAFFSGLSCLILFEISYHLVKKFEIRNSIQIPAALCGPLLVAFSDTFWFNAVEAEVYALAMFFIVLELWLILLWEKAGAEPFSRLILLIVYVAYLGIGVHMYSMLLLPIFFTYYGWRTGRLVFRLGVRLFLFTNLAFLLAAFLFPRLSDLKGFWICWGCSAAGLFLYSVIKKEIVYLQYWAIAFLLSIVIGWVEPVIVGLCSLLLLLNVILVFQRPRKIVFWLLLVAVALGVWGLGVFISKDGHMLSLLLKPLNLFVFGASVMAAALSLFSVRGAHRPKHHANRFMYIMVLLAAIGYSTSVYIPVRSSLNPALDENNPDNWSRLISFIERKQYGSENMLIRMLNRRGAWQSQFGDGVNIGFFRFLSGQLVPIPAIGHGSSLPISVGLHQLLMFFVLVFVVYDSFGRIRAANNGYWLFLVSALFVSSVGLVLYMNFSDGTRIEVYQLNRWNRLAQKSAATLSEKTGERVKLPNPNQINLYLATKSGDGNFFQRYKKKRYHSQYKQWQNIKQLGQQNGIQFPDIPPPVHREVRIRDYFYTPGFILFIVLMSLLFFIRFSRWFGSRRNPRAIATALAWMIGCGLWLLPFGLHFHSHNRLSDTIARDFAHNLLSACPSGAILFTNGDNDTFPLWYYQLVERFRPDISVVNFSLANTDWYTQQMVTGPSPIKLPTIQSGKNFPPPKYFWFEAPQKVPLPGHPSIAMSLGAKKSARLLKTQDRVLMETMLYNFPARPVCFTASTPSQSMLGLEGHLMSFGLVNCVSGQPGLNLNQMETHLLNQGRFEHIGGMPFELSRSARRIVRSYIRALSAGLQVRKSQMAEQPSSALNDIIKKYRHLLEQLEKSLT